MYDGAKVAVSSDEGERADRRPDLTGVARSLGPMDIEEGVWQVSPTGGGPPSMVAQAQLRVLLPPPPSQGALGQLRALVSSWEDRVSLADEELVLSVLSQAAESGTVHDFRRVVECVPGRAVSPGLFMKAVAIASMWTRRGAEGSRGEGSEGEAALQQLMDCRSFLPPARHFAQERGGEVWEEAAESLRDYFVRFSYLGAFEAAAEVAAARDVLTGEGGKGGGGGKGKGGGGGKGKGGGGRASADGAAGGEAEEGTAGRCSLYEGLRLRRVAGKGGGKGGGGGMDSSGGSSFLCSMPNGATPPRQGDSLLVDTACERRGVWGVWASGSGGDDERGGGGERGNLRGTGLGERGGGTAPDGDAMRRFRLFKVEDVRKGGGGGSSNHYDVGHGMSFKLSELGAHPSAGVVAWEPLPNDRLRASAGPSLTVHRRIEVGLERVTYRRSLLEPAQLRLCDALSIYTKPQAAPPIPKTAVSAAIAAAPDTIITHPVWGRLNPSQRQAYLAATAPDSALTLVQGPPGTGKTFTSLAILQRWIEQLRAAHVVVEKERAILRAERDAEAAAAEEEAKKNSTRLYPEGYRAGMGGKGGVGRFMARGGGKGGGKGKGTGGGKGMVWVARAGAIVGEGYWKKEGAGDESSEDEEVCGGDRAQACPPACRFPTHAALDALSLSGSSPLLASLMPLSRFAGQPPSKGRQAASARPAALSHPRHRLLQHRHR